LIDDGLTNLRLVRDVSPCITSCSCNPPPVTTASSAAADEDTRSKLNNETVKSTFTETCEGLQ
jgi:hypothetical protein